MGLLATPIYEADLLDGLGGSGNFFTPGWEEPISEIECQELVADIISLNEDVVDVEALEDPVDYEKDPRILNLHDPRAIEVTRDRLTCEAEATLDTGKKGRVRFWLAQDPDGERHYSYVVTDSSD